MARTYNLTEVGQQVEVLQDELVSVKEEIRILRSEFRRDISFLYLLTSSSHFLVLYLALLPFIFRSLHSLLCSFSRLPCNSPLSCFVTSFVVSSNPLRYYAT